MEERAPLQDADSVDIHFGRMDGFTFDDLMAALDDDDESWIFMNTILPNTTYVGSSSSSTQERDKRSMSGFEYINHILNERPKVPYDYLRMNKTKFMALCKAIMAKDIVKTNEVTIEEQLGMFLHIVGHASNMRSVSYNFQRSLDTVHWTFNDILWSIIDMRNDYIKQPTSNTPRHAFVEEDTSFFPFKGALGAIDGTHIPAFVKKKKRRKYINRKGFVSQNVMAAVDFDMNFVYVSIGWEGSAADMKVLRSALDDGGFTVPAGRYYLADSGYANTGSFLCPYCGHIYHLEQFQQVAAHNRYQTPEDLFNHRHAQLRNVVERTFGVLKMRFKILKSMQPYKYRKQCLIVLACCILHNFIKRQNEIESESDKFLDEAERIIIERDYDPEDVEQSGITPGLNETQLGDLLRTGVKDTLWENMQARNRNRRRRRN